MLSSVTMSVRMLAGNFAIGGSGTVPGSFNDLAVRFCKLDLPTVADSTARDYRAVIEPLHIKHGHKRVAHMHRRHVIEIKADLAETPTQANKTMKRLSQMMDLAVDLEWRTDNPVKGVKRFPTNPEGYHGWDVGEISRLYEVYKLGSAAHRAMTLMLYTGASRGDAVKLGRGNIRDGRIVYRRRKTKKNPEGFEVNIPVHPYLAKTLAHVAPSAFTFLQTLAGTSRSPDGLGNKMRQR